MTQKEGDQHKNDMYGDIGGRDESAPGVLPPIPSATVVLLRDGEEGIEVLMLKKNSKITFGGMWVFPGGKIDAEDYQDNATDVATPEALEAAARSAAAREAEEEAGIRLSADDFVWFAHWTPPPGPQKRFATWFFAGLANDTHDEITIDDGEIKDHAWITPAAALERHRRGEIDLVPPTWVTLYHLSQYSPATEVMKHFESQVAKIYSTRVVKAEDGNRVAMWTGDAGYEAWNPDVSGERHRLVMAKDGFEFQNSIESY
jgi:8-oxo-dGTP pyrophosphatase MutT (NUDIX family)